MFSLGLKSAKEKLVLTDKPSRIFPVQRVAFAPSTSHFVRQVIQVMPFHGEQLYQYWLTE